MSNPSLTFPTATSVSREEFFSRASDPVPSPTVLAILEQAKPVDGSPDGDTEGTPDTPVQVATLHTDLDPKVAEILAAFGTDEPAEPVVPAEPTTTEPATATEEEISTSAVPYHIIAETLREKGIISDIPEDFPVDGVNETNFVELVEHNVNKSFNSGYEAAFTDLPGALTPETFEIVRFQLANPNASPQDVRQFTDNVLYSRDISELDPADPYDAETIVRQYLAVDNDAEEVEAQIADYKEIKKLEQWAAKYKPKVEQRAQQEIHAAKQKQMAIVQQDNAMHQEFMAKVDTVLKSGKLLGVDISAKDKARLNAIVSQNRVPVPVNGGGTAELGFAEYLLRANMYGREGKTENLLMALLVLEGGAAVVEKLAAPVKKEAALKFEAQKAKGTFSAAPAAQTLSQHKPKPLEERRKAFFSREQQR
jgi:hypothetical protein